MKIVDSVKSLTLEVKRHLVATHAMVTQADYFTFRIDFIQAGSDFAHRDVNATRELTNFKLPRLADIKNKRGIPFGFDSIRELSGSYDVHWLCIDCPLKHKCFGFWAIDQRLCNGFEQRNTAHLTLSVFAQQYGLHDWLLADDAD
jgi:hypothetical protein